MRSALLLTLVVAACAQDEYDGFVGHWVNVAATAYSPSDPIDEAYHASKGSAWRWKTADGTTDVRRVPYGIAVPLFPGTTRPALSFRTRIVIPTGYGYLDRIRPQERVFQVDDTGDGKEYYGTRNGMMHVDLRFRDHASAIAWAGPEGWRKIRVFLVDGPAPHHPKVTFEVDDNVRRAVGPEGLRSMEADVTAMFHPQQPVAATPVEPWPARPPTPESPTEADPDDLSAADIADGILIGLFFAWVFWRSKPESKF